MAGENSKYPAGFINFILMETAIDLNGKYSYSDYLGWPDEERWELIGGYPYNMSPAPSRRHQEVLGEIYRVFSDFFEGRPCKVFLSPFDVRLAEDYSDNHIVNNVVQPDLSVFCKKEHLDKQGAKGAPDLVVEVLSPSTASKDLKTKLLLYQRFKVKEYWIVDPEKETIEVIRLDETGKYNPGIIADTTQKALSTIFDGLIIDIGALFQKVND
jgi:Uma2 family endonuclease